MIRFTCPNCEHRLKAANDTAGTIKRCRNCEVRFRVPFPTAIPRDGRELDRSNARSRSVSPMWVGVFLLLVGAGAYYVTEYQPNFFSNSAASQSRPTLTIPIAQEQTPDAVAVGTTNTVGNTNTTVGNTNTTSRTVATPISQVKVTNPTPVVIVTPRPVYVPDHSAERAKAQQSIATLSAEIKRADAELTRIYNAKLALRGAQGLTRIGERNAETTWGEIAWMVLNQGAQQGAEDLQRDDETWRRYKTDCETKLQGWRTYLASLGN